YTAAHWPMHARERDIEKYAGRYAAGYDAVRRARYGRMLEEGVVSAANATLVPLPAGLGETGDLWAWDQRNMEVFAAMVDCMDRGIGRIVEAIDAIGQTDNTLVCYLQDNGGCAETIGRAAVKPGGDAPLPRRPQAPTLPPQPAGMLQPDMIPRQTRDGFPMRVGQGVMAGAGDTFVAYGEAWSTVSNTPFRRHKHWVHEGGISTPLVVHWPRGVTRPGRLVHTPGHLVDVMATVIELAGARYPADKTPLEGTSLVPLLAGGAIDRGAIYWEHEGNRAVREGDWKLVAVHGGPWELYDLSTDRSEQHDASQRQPDRVRRMAALWEAYAERADVADWARIAPAKP
ncbi:MAG: sulfatase-like hydrolase/transferase, partial [Planctomycetia bacterium]